MSTPRLVALCLVSFVVVSFGSALASPIDQQVNDTRSFIEFVFGFKLDPATVQSIHDGLATDMSNDPSGSAATLKDMNDVMTWVHSQPAAAGALLRSYIEPDLIASFQSDTSTSAGTSKALVATWRKHNQIVADGQPPLRKDVVTAYIDMFEFVAQQSGKPVPAEVSNRGKFTARVASQYAAATPDSQLKFNRVQTLWLALQTMWARATPAEKATLRQQWHAAVATTHASSGAGTSPTAKPQSGFSGQIFDEQKYKEKLFVDGEARVWMSTWSNPFAQ